MILAFRSDLVIARLKELFRTVNPFACLDGEGRYVVYSSRCDAYYDVLSDLVELYPNGYIPLRLYFTQKCGLTYAQVTRLERLSLSSRFLKGFEVLWDYHGERKENMQKAENILRTMHLLTDTKFDNDSFLLAYSMIENRYFSSTKDEAK